MLIWHVRTFKEPSSPSNKLDKEYIGLRNLGAHREILGITDVQAITVEHEEFGTPMPVGVAKQSIPKFPTPGRVITTLTSGTDKRRMLERLHFEYSFLTGHEYR